MLSNTKFYFTETENKNKYKIQNYFKMHSFLLKFCIILELARNPYFLCDVI